MTVRVGGVEQGGVGSLDSKYIQVINQLKIPLRAKFTTGNVHDGTMLKELIISLIALFLLGDTSYDSKENRRICKQQGITPVIPYNQRNAKKPPLKPRYHMLLRKFRYLIEQSYSELKEMLKGYWVNVKGFERKAVLLYSGIIAQQVIGINALLSDDKVLRRIGMYK